MNSLTDPKFKAFDANGDPLSGGKLYTYEEGTATKKTTYSDVNLTSANANPIVLDSRGEASIFGDGSYKFVLATSTASDPPAGGDTLWTVDGIFSKSGSTDFEATSSDAGAAAGPSLKLYRNSASPADNDIIGSILFEGENDNDERITYGEIKVTIKDVTDSTEDAYLQCYTMVAGSLSETLRVGDRTALGKFTTVDGANATAIGFEASAGSTSSTAVGHGVSAAGSDSTAVGNNSTASGSAAMAVGNNCTAVGDQTTIVGDQSHSGTGDRGISVGALAGATGTTGNDNVFIGYRSGVGTTSAVSNTCVGNLAGEDLTTGNDNTFIGYNAGNGGTAGINMTCIGHDATPTGSNEVTIGDSDVATTRVQVDWTILSDERDKEDRTPIKNGLSFVMALEPINYRLDRRSKYFKDENPKPKTEPELIEWKKKRKAFFKKPVKDGRFKEEAFQAGFTAQNVEAALKKAKCTMGRLHHYETEETDQYEMSNTEIIPFLVKAVQELSAEVKKLKGKK